MICGVGWAILYYFAAQCTGHTRFAVDVVQVDALATRILLYLHFLILQYFCSVQPFTCESLGIVLNRTITKKSDISVCGWLIRRVTNSTPIWLSLARAKYSIKVITKQGSLGHKGAVGAI